MKRKKHYYLLTTLMLVLSACFGTATADFSTQTGNTEADSPVLDTTSQATLTPPVSADFAADDLTSTPNDATSSITLNIDSIAVTGEGVTVNGSSATITDAGSYEISGTLRNGQIVVDTQDVENVVILLAGADIHNENSAPIYVANAKKVIITLAEGTQNNISDGASYADLDKNGEPNAAIFSHDNLTINGTGVLTVTANYNNGITSKDDLKITGGTITVTAVNDGIKGKDSVAIEDGLITINASADGIQSTNEEKAEKGYIAIEGGTLNITSAQDGIQAATSLRISSGDLTIETSSGKGINAGANLSITGGTFNIISADDSIHANSNLTIDDGVFQLASGDGGIRSKTSLTINGGSVNITRSIEGLESALITINNGNVRLIASDDGINAATGSRDEQTNSNYIYINGGYVLVEASGDGLDSNGSVVMTGGTVIVNGPTQNNNGALDYDDTFNISGGLLVAVGSSGMAEAPSQTSTQYSVIHNFESAQATETLIHIQNQNGTDVLTFAPSKEFQSVVLSSPALENGMTYTLYVGGTANGGVVDGLYANGNYSPGTEVASFTITNMVTRSGIDGDGHSSHTLNGEELATPQD